MATDYGIAVEALLGPGIKWRQAHTYAALVATWEDAAAIPSQQALDNAYTTWQSQQATRALAIAYLQTFYTNREAIGGIFMTFSEGFRTAGASPTLAQYRTVLSDTLVKVYALPTAFVNEFDTERTALALPALAAAPTYASALTLAQCQSWHAHLGRWVTMIMSGAAIAISVR